jgi:hypothetical protein
MAEALGVASGVAGLLSLTITVVDASYRYVSNVRNASKAVQAYFRELSTLKKVLVQLDEVVHNPEITDLLSARRSFLSTDGIDDCKSELERLHQKLKKRKADNAFNRLTWPFAEEDTRKIVEVLHRYQNIFHMALSTDGLLASITLPMKKD